MSNSNKGKKLCKWQGLPYFFSSFGQVMYGTTISAGKANNQTATQPSAPIKDTSNPRGVNHPVKTFKRLPNRFLIL